jgi:hypothetical protein
MSGVQKQKLVLDSISNIHNIRNTDYMGQHVGYPLRNSKTKKKNKRYSSSMDEIEEYDLGEL